MSILFMLVSSAIVIPVVDAIEKAVWRHCCPRPRVHRAKRYQFD